MQSAQKCLRTSSLSLSSKEHLCLPHKSHRRRVGSSKEIVMVTLGRRSILSDPFLSPEKLVAHGVRPAVRAVLDRVIAGYTAA